MPLSISTELVDHYKGQKTDLMSNADQLRLIDRLTDLNDRE